MSMLRSDIRTRSRDYLYESTADMFTDPQLNRLIQEEINSLPRKSVYKEEIHTATLVVNQLSYSLPSGTKDVEKVEINRGTATQPWWDEVNGWKKYQGGLYFPYLPTTTDTIRIHVQKSWLNPSDDVTALDMDDDMTELVVWGTVVRAYKMQIGFLRQSKNWDSISKPDGISIASMQGWLRDAEQKYNGLLRDYISQPMVKDINLVE